MQRQVDGMLCPAGGAEMSIGSGIAIAGMWIAMAIIILGFQKISTKSEFSPFGVLLLCVIAAIATGTAVGVH